ncbi:hypothetical protein CLU79DRAFT_695223, partial [Phycomyces nitens]
INIQLLFVNGKGVVGNKHSRPESMYYIINKEQFFLEMLSSHTQYRIFGPE